MNYRNLCFVLAICVSGIVARASVVVTSNINLTTSPNPGGGNNDGTGVWFNPSTGYSEARGFPFPNPLFEDGKFFLVMDTRFSQTEAEIFTQGLFSRGNTVIYASNANLNPARFGDGEVIGPGVGFQQPGAGFVDLGPTFGNWAAAGHGYIGLVIRNPAGATSSNVFYGYAEININPDFSITLLSMAYNNVEGAPLTTVSTVPEPAALSSLVALAMLLRRRRNKKGLEV